jgi:hypothetical protein
MDQAERMARNLQLARTFYEGWRDAGKRGEVVGWTADDWAPNAVIFCTWGQFSAGGHDYGEGATFELNSYLKVLPDLTADKFEAWPTEDGCAWRQMFCGHTAEGEYHEWWEVEFIRTDADGRITRWEFFDDWIGTPRVVELVTGLSTDKMDPQTYLTKVLGESPLLPEILAGAQDQQKASS